jgi:hypothetical protein
VYDAGFVVNTTLLTIAHIVCTEERWQERERLCVHHLLAEPKAQATAGIDALGMKALEEWRVGKMYHIASDGVCG